MELQSSPSKSMKLGSFLFCEHNSSARRTLHYPENNKFGLTVILIGVSEGLEVAAVSWVYLFHSSGLVLSPAFRLIQHDPLQRFAVVVRLGGLCLHLVSQFIRIDGKVEEFVAVGRVEDEAPSILHDRSEDDLVGLMSRRHLAVDGARLHAQLKNV